MDAAPYFLILVTSLVAVQAQSQTCRDDNPGCPHWKDYCDDNHRSVLMRCRLTCNTCDLVLEDDVDSRNQDRRQREWREENERRRQNRGDRTSTEIARQTESEALRRESQRQGLLRRGQEGYDNQDGGRRPEEIRIRGSTSSYERRRAETARRQAEREEAIRRETERRLAARREEEARREEARREAERREAERREEERRRETERREARRRQTERWEAERREEQRRRETERREEERRRNSQRHGHRRNNYNFQRIRMTDRFDDCEDRSQGCPYWTRFCTENYQNVLRKCKKTCGLCRDERPDRSQFKDLFDTPLQGCKDDYPACKDWSAYCTDRYASVRQYCRKTCDTCGGQDGFYFEGYVDPEISIETDDYFKTSEEIITRRPQTPPRPAQRATPIHQTVVPSVVPPKIHRVMPPNEIDDWDVLVEVEGSGSDLTNNKKTLNSDTEEEMEL